MEDIEIKTCPFCGKYVMCSPDEPPEDVCDCPEAQHKRESAMRFEKLKTAIETSCGEGCEKTLSSAQAAQRGPINRRR